MENGHGGGIYEFVFVHLLSTSLFCYHPHWGISIEKVAIWSCLPLPRAIANQAFNVLYISQDHSTIFRRICYFISVGMIHSIIASLRRTIHDQ